MDEENIDSSAPKKSVAKKTVDLQRMKIEKLMSNPEKPVYIPEKRSGKKFPDAPEFVRNVMGSSAGAGSGEFHVYRHIRRREYARNIYLQKMKDHLSADDEYQLKLEDNKRLGEEKTAKKRAKRQRYKSKKKYNKQNKGKQSKLSESEDSSEEDSDELSNEGKEDSKQKTSKQDSKQCDQEIESTENTKHTDKQDREINSKIEKINDKQDKEINSNSEKIV